MIKHQNKSKMKSTKKQNKNQILSNSNKNKDVNKRRNKKSNQGNSSIETLNKLKDISSCIDELPTSFNNLVIIEDNKTNNKISLIENKTLNTSSNTELTIPNLNIQQSILINNNSNNLHNTFNQQFIQHFNQFNQNINKSRLPHYSANGQTFGYKQPSSFNYNLNQSISTHNLRTDSRLSTNSSLLPSEVFSIHSNHLTNNCSNINRRTQFKHNSTPNSIIQTPSISSPATPSDSRRSSKTQNQLFNKTKQQQLDLNNKSLIKKSNLKNKTFKFEEYMPLCKIQNMLGKGQIVEGVLRINQRNFEDAYISAPGEGEMDIRIFGKKNINRAFNNDVVAVEIKPLKEWNIQYNVIESNWASWKDEIIDIINRKKLTAEQQFNEQCLDGETINLTLNESVNREVDDEFLNKNDNGSRFDVAIHESDEYESAKEDFDISTITGTSIDERIYLTEEFFPDDKQFDFSNYCSGYENKITTNVLNGNPDKAQIATQKSFNPDGINLKLLEPKDLIGCSFYKRCLQQTGKVVHILKSSSNKICGGRLRLQHAGSDFVVFETTDKRIPNFLVAISDCPSDFAFNSHFYKNSLFLGEIKRWPATSKYPFGKLHHMIGNAGEIDTETEILLVENNVDTSEFPPNIEHGLPITPGSETYQIPVKEIKKRNDLRNELVFTIDPATARDLDDALSIKKISKHSIPEKEIYEVGVHIADVSYFVKEKLPIDEIARKRTTSIYCVQKVIPMLPRILCEKYCSLNPGEDKLTFSVFWHMNSNGDIVKEWFERTVIRSAIKLSYEIAADMIEKPPEQFDWNQASEGLPEIHSTEYNYNDVAKSVNLLKKIASNLRSKRFKHGALEITKPEIRFVLDDTRYNVLGFTTDKPQSTSLVEEFMLLANISVAKKIYLKFPKKSFLRRHPLPERKMLNDFLELCQNAGLDMDISSSKQLQASLLEIKKLVDDDTYKFLCLKLLKTMRPAEYFTTIKISNYEQFAHYALSESIYTHFTSPIRRYPDIIVHRLLAACLNLDKEPKMGKDIDDLVTRCNDMKLANRIVSETSQKIYLSIYILTIGHIQQNAIVMQVFDRAFDCFLTKLNITLRVYCDQLGIDSCDYDHMNDNLKLYYKDRKNFVLIKVLAKVNLKITIPDKNFLLKWHAILV